MAIFRLFFIFLIFTTLLGANVQSGSQPVHHVKHHKKGGAGGEHPHQKIKGPAGVGSVAKDAYKEGQQVVQNASPGFAGKLKHSNKYSTLRILLYGFGWRYHKRCWEFSRWCTWLKMLPKKDDRN
ncbi:hypothetical protein NPIL_593501 [Nephila pilipes]|uniref:Uncharacterized protein n=1 Tax=Nephila pilipes TaxID=299642 RepID=A0A8X6R8Q3_NEPPI|nr:hypothetical protein NPIL_593501 [Nephila pilipes]